MITFSIALLFLILGYVVYGRIVERHFGADASRTVPSKSMADGVDYMELPTWKAYMIQFLNIAGLGPIFGAIMGAKFGTASYLWIVLGTIFGGAVHDYLSGMVSLRHGGESLSELVGRYLGDVVKKIFTIFLIVLMIMVCCVFASQPAALLAGLTPSSLNVNFWMLVIFAYYLVATLFPIDKIIGHLYPFMGAALLFMAFGILISLYVSRPELPEMWNGFGTRYEKSPIFPMMFVSIACGAVSGFHATQSPLMARCIRSEKNGRFVFYGSMVSEGIVALIWAAASTAYFQNHGTGETAADVAMNISKEMLGNFGGIIAILGIVAAPISTGDTALRSARLIVADSFKFSQKEIHHRLMITIPLFAVALGLLFFSLTNPDGFSIMWRYFAWCNQVLSVFTFWALSVYLAKHRKNFLMTLIPAVFMSFVTITYIQIAPEGFNVPIRLAYPITALITVDFLVLFWRWHWYYFKQHPKD
ncbi:MAG: carbon starvation protein A [Bacteroidaceae bacterium]|nr:carbon starvation protein A [Bacteroidaceae bacterium]